MGNTQGGVNLAPKRPLSEYIQFDLPASASDLQQIKQMQSKVAQSETVEDITHSVKELTEALNKYTALESRG